MIQRENDGVRWELQPNFAPLLDALLKTPGEIVKESPVKSVTRHQVDGATFYIKRYLHHTVALRPLKFLFKPTQARQEWELAQQLEARKIPIVRHVALGERRSWRGVEESILITEGFDGLPLKEAKDVAPEAVLEFVQHLHESGVLQRDLHSGNVLARSHPLELRLVDLDGIVIKPFLHASEKALNLASLRHAFPISLPAELDDLCRRQRQELYFSRSSRWKRRNRDFGPLSAGKLRWQARLSLIDETALKIMAAPDAFLATEAKLLKKGRSSTVGQAVGLVLKRYNLRKPGNLLKDIFRPSRASRAFRLAYHMELLGIRTARGVAASDDRVLGLPVRSFFLMENIPDAVDLGTYLREGRTLKPATIREIAEIIGRLHEEGFAHRDLKQTNLLIDPEERVHLIDLDGLKFVRTVPEERCARDLARLAEGMRQYPAVGARQRASFLRAYCRVRRLRRIPRPLRVERL